MRIYMEIMKPKEKLECRGSINFIYENRVASRATNGLIIMGRSNLTDNDHDY